MIRAILLFLFAFCITSSKSDIDEARLSYRNLLKNPGAENGKAGVAVSNTANLAIETTAAEVARGSASFHWTPTAASETILFGVASPDGEVEKGQCLASGVIKPDATYSTGVIVARVENSGSPLTDDLDLGPLTSGEWKPFQIAFICPDTGSIDLEFEVTGASGFKIDSLWLGRDYRLGQTPFEGWITYDQNDVTVTSAQPGFTVDGAWFRPWKDKSGNWYLTFNIEASFTPATISVLFMDITGVDFLNSFNQGMSGFFGNNINNAVGHRSTVISASGDRIELYVNATGNLADVYVSGDVKLQSKPTWADDQLPSPTVTLETQGWYISGDIGGAQISLSTSDLGISTEITNGSLDLVLENGSAPAKIACANAPAEGLTCTGNESIGVNFNAPYAGVYRACFNVINAWVMDSTGDDITNYFYVVKRQNATSTIITQGKNVSSSGVNWNVAINTFSQQTNYVCDDFNLTAGENTLSIYYRVNAGGSPVGNFVQAERGAGINGEKTVGFSVIPLTQNFPQAIAITNNITMIDNLDDNTFVNGVAKDVTATTMTLAPGDYIIDYGGHVRVSYGTDPTYVNFTLQVTDNSNVQIGTGSFTTGISKSEAFPRWRGVGSNSYQVTIATETIVKLRASVSSTGGGSPTEIRVLGGFIKATRKRQ